jgi:protein-S-isoprenylcysteine O-methyltransferase Ste14
LVADHIAFVLIVLWPVIPLWWIPVHAAKELVQRIGPWAYVIICAAWLSIACLLYVHKEPILAYRLDLPLFIRIVGILLLISGGLLQLWTIRALTIKGITGKPELENETDGTLVTNGPFAIARHPTYLSHTLMFLGAFLWTGIIAAGLVTLIDFTVIHAMIIPLEERELLIRFGGVYESYAGRTSRFFPRIRKGTWPAEPRTKDKSPNPP